MELLTQRYRSLTILVLVIAAQVLLLGFQVRSQQDVRLLRVWAVTAVTPAARALETVRSEASSLIDNYLLLVGVRRENERLKTELGELKREALYLRGELATAERGEALKAFRERNPSRVVAARIIGAGTGSGSQEVFVDRGTGDGVVRGMAVITPDGIVGKVLAAYPTASQVVLVTDQGFAAGVISQKNHVQGTLKGWGRGLCIVDYIQHDEKLEVGEWFYTSGDDRVFPRGLPVGQVEALREGTTLQEVYVRPSGLRNGLEEVLIVLEGRHQPIAGAAADDRTAALLPAAPDTPAAVPPGAPKQDSSRALRTDADRLMERYREVGAAQGHVFGEGEVGTPPPDFNAPPAGAPAASSAVQ